MKTRFLIMLFFLSYLGVAMAKDDFLIITGGSLKTALEKATRENKLLILEFSAKWCLPCRYMEKQVFGNLMVQNYTSQYAIIYQVDIDENKNLKEEFSIESLPTLIMMKASGEILSRKEESLDVNGFISWIEKNKDRNPITEISLTKEQFEDASLIVQIPDLNETSLNKEVERELKNLKSNNYLLQENYYYLQAGVFETKQNAEKLAAKLKVQFKHFIEIIEENKNLKINYKVHIGQFNERHEAIVFQNELKEQNIETVIRLK